MDVAHQGWALSLWPYSFRLAYRVNALSVWREAWERPAGGPDRAHGRNLLPFQSLTAGPRARRRYVSP
jgi:hypothetical protein